MTHTGEAPTMTEPEAALRDLTRRLFPTHTPPDPEPQADPDADELRTFTRRLFTPEEEDE